MLIGEVSRRAGASVQAIRLYERRRLLRKPPRTPAGYRVYSEQDLEVVRLIRQAQQYGFTLRELRKILALFAVPDERTGRTPYGRGEHACVMETLRIGEEKLRDLDEQIASLRKKRRELAAALAKMRSTGAPSRKRVSRSTTAQPAA